MSQLTRDQLVAKLDIVAPALSTSDMIPALQTFWFTGTRLVAFNDAIGVSVSFQTPFKGAVHGDTFRRLMSASRGNVEMSAADDVLNVKVGGSRQKFGLLGPDTFVWSMPPAKLKDKFPVDAKQFVDALGTCMLSVTSDTTIPDQLGVTLIPGDKVLALYSTNGATITRVSIPIKGQVTWKRAILSAPFCEQVMRLSDGKELHLEVHDDYALFVSGGAQVFGRLIYSPKPLPFSKVATQYFPQEARANLIAVPERFASIIERACIMTNASPEKTKASVAVRDNVIFFESRVDGIGEVNDRITLKDVKHGDAEIMIDPRLVKLGLNKFDKMLFTNECVAFAKGSASYLIAATTGD